MSTIFYLYLDKYLFIYLCVTLFIGGVFVANSVWCNGQKVYTKSSNDSKLRWTKSIIQQ